ncbi:peptidylprolyl isomerase [Candidatus Pelagibacter sp.]|nr:peptidylprolyl isomerase [Candidatus Pelagibacter sp.]
MRKAFIIIFLIYSNLFAIEAQSKIEIRFKIGDEIVTNIDIIEEKKYLIFLRPNLKKLSEEEILKIAQNSLIREIIKKKELKRVFKDDENLRFMKEIKRNLFAFKNVANETEFKNLMIKNNINYEKIVSKMKYEAMWNELIFQKYSSFIKINKQKLNEELKDKINKGKNFEYNLSEILFELKNDENLNKKKIEILKFIELNDFKIGATKYSISNSAKRGGEIGWIKETMLSKNLNSILSKMTVNQISDSIEYPNGYLLLKLNNKREIKREIDMKKELNDLINFERNRQLSQFSLLYYKKLKQNIIINEY